MHEKCASLLALRGTAQSFLHNEELSINGSLKWVSRNEGSLEIGQGITRISKGQGATECAGGLGHFVIILVSIILVGFTSGIGHISLCIVIDNKLSCKMNKEDKKLKRKNEN